MTETSILRLIEAAAAQQVCARQAQSELSNRRTSCAPQHRHLARETLTGASSSLFPLRLHTSKVKSVQNPGLVWSFSAERISHSSVHRSTDLPFSRVSVCSVMLGHCHTSCIWRGAEVNGAHLADLTHKRRFAASEEEDRRLLAC